MNDTTAKSTFRLLSEFRRLFEGHIYKHRASNQGDLIAMQLYEDVVAINRSPKLVSAIASGELVLNVANRLQGIRARRGDGTLGEIIPGEIPIRDKGYSVARGKIATVEIGIEVKILAKAMIKQIDRVINDLRNQADQFRKSGQHAICVAIVGINQAENYVSFEGRQSFPTTGRDGYLHPIQEAAEAERRLLDHVASSFNEFLVFRFRATIKKPYPFDWADFDETRLDYAAALARISSTFQQKF